MIFLLYFVIKERKIVKMLGPIDFTSMYNRMTLIEFTTATLQLQCSMTKDLSKKDLGK